MSDHSNKDESHSGHHVIVPLNIYTRVFGTLIVLTLLTVTSSYVDFGGNWNILIAMGIATMKALLVIMFFMGLRYDGQENNVAFFISFGFLAIFVGLTSSDLFYRTDVQPVKVDASELAAMNREPVDVAKFIKPTPELVAKGHALFLQQCATCHGDSGQGNGPASGSLTPKPRNFTSAEGWKFGRGVTQIFHTITNGSPGTAMPPFSPISPEERFALAHYVRTLTPAPPMDTPDQVAALQKEYAGGAGKPRLSVDSAMGKLEHEWAASHRSM
jgi:cytochrome c oxidase subunit 4